MLKMICFIFGELFPREVFSSTLFYKNVTLNKVVTLNCETFSNFLFLRVGAIRDETSSQISQSIKDWKNKGV